MENIALQMGMNMKAWQNPYNFAHEYSGWMNYRQFQDVDATDKDTLDIMDENILLLIIKELSGILTGK